MTDQLAKLGARGNQLYNIVSFQEQKGSHQNRTALGQNIARDVVHVLEL